MKIRLTLAALAFAGLSTLASAQSTGFAPSVDVSYGDLNLQHPAGAAAVMRRIRTAAEQVCGGSPDLREVPETTRFRACVSTVVRNAVADLNAARMSGAASGRRGTIVVTRR